MRIPSQFNEDNLYRRGSRRTDSDNSLRRILRMVVALVLLMFVMRQAGKPGVYEVFFGGQSESAAQTVVLSGDDVDRAVTSTQQQRVQELPVTEPCRQLATALTRALPLAEQRQWTAILARWNSGQPFPLVQSLVDQTHTLLSDLSDVDQSQRDAWNKTLEKFGKIYGHAELIAAGEPSPRGTEPQRTESAQNHETSSDEAIELSAQDAMRLVAWFGALDSAALARVVDGSVWRSADFDAFYLQLQQADSLSGRGAVTTSVVPLLQQPEVYRGQLVRMAGSIAKAERLDASANPHSIKEYWQLWIKPDTGSDRPFVFIVPALPSNMQEAVADGGQPHGQFIGRFFKRLAYRSQAGADLAPVVIGRVLTPTAAANVPRAVVTGSESAANKQRLWLTLLIASVTGVSLAAIAMWRTSVAGKRARELRGRRQQPDGFLGELRRADIDPNRKANDD